MFEYISIIIIIKSIGAKSVSYGTKLVTATFSDIDKLSNLYEYLIRQFYIHSHMHQMPLQNLDILHQWPYFSKFLVFGLVNQVIDKQHLPSQKLHWLVLNRLFSSNILFSIFLLTFQNILLDRISNPLKSFYHSCQFLPL